MVYLGEEAADLRVMGSSTDPGPPTFKLSYGQSVCNELYGATPAPLGVAGV